MKLKIRYFLCAIIFLFAAVSFCSPGKGEVTNEQVINKIIKTMHLKAGMNPKEHKAKMLSLAEQIAADNKLLQEYFMKQDFCRMAELYKERGAVLVTPEYEKVYGMDSAKFWRALWTEGAELKIDTVNVYLSNVIEERTVQVLVADPTGKKRFEDRTLECVAFAVQEFHIIVKKQGSVVHNATGKEDRTYLHQNNCTWF